MTMPNACTFRRSRVVCVCVQLQMLMLVCSTSYVTTAQARRLLATFCPKVSQQELNRAAMLLHTALPDPLDYWPDLLPLQEPSVQADMLELARTAGVLDLGNPTNRWRTLLQLCYAHMHVFVCTAGPREPHQQLHPVSPATGSAFV